MSNFSDFSTWGTYLVLGMLFAALLLANALKKTIPFLGKSLIPTSVIGGTVLLLIALVYKLITDEVFWDQPIFAGKGTDVLEVLTYHCLALGFIASSFKTMKNKMNKKRASEIFNSGVTTVATYLLQAIFGFGITLIIAAFFLKDFFPAAGMLLPFGYGQGSGQALNYGNIYQTDFGFEGGRSFGLAIAALGFVSAAIGGVIHMNIRRRSGKLVIGAAAKEHFTSEDIQTDNEIPMQESVDKLTIQVALIAVAYFVTYGLMYFLAWLLPSMSSVIYGFNFLLGVISATLIKQLIKFLRKKNVMKKDYINNFLLTRTSNFFFDIMIIAGMAAINLDIIGQYFGILLILGVVGAVITYIYNRIVARYLFSKYKDEQFLAMYGMLTGTASTGVVLLREIDPNFDTPASDNLVYQTLPAIAFGFPMMVLATLAPVKPILTMIIFVVFFIALNVILFRNFIFKRRKKK